MIRKGLTIILVMSFLFVFGGVKYIFAQDACPGSCCCHATGSNQDRVPPQHTCCCGTIDISACDMPLTPVVSQEMAFSQESVQKLLAPVFIFSALSTGPTPQEGPSLSALPDHPLGKYFKIPLYLSNLSLII